MTRLHRQDVTIANGATTSPEVDLREFEVLGIQMPGAFTGTTVAFTSVVVDDGVPGDQTFLAVQDGAGAAVSITVAASKFVILTQAQNFATVALARTKLVVSSQAADRVLTLITRQLA